MLIKDILSNDYVIHTKIETLDRFYTGVHCGDLLSVVMRSAIRGSILISVIGNPNSVAVAMLLDLPAIIITEGQSISIAMIEKANAENIALMTSKLKSHEVIIDLKDRGLI